MQVGNEPVLDRERQRPATGSENRARVPGKTRGCILGLEPEVGIGIGDPLGRGDQSRVRVPLRQHPFLTEELDRAGAADVVEVEKQPAVRVVIGQEGLGPQGPGFLAAAHQEHQAG